MCSDILGSVSWWSDVSAIALVVHSNLQLNKFSADQTKYLPAALVMSFKIPFPMQSHFCLEAFESKCWRWTLYGFTLNFYSPPQWPIRNIQLRCHFLHDLLWFPLYSLVDNFDDSPCTGYCDVDFFSWNFTHIKNSLPTT